MFSFIDAAKGLMFVMVVTANIDYKHIFNNIVATVREPSTIAIRALYQYSKIKSRWIQCGKGLYQKYLWIKVAIDRAYYVASYLHSKWSYTGLEPYSNQWISLYTLTEDCFFTEKYDSIIWLNMEAKSRATLVAKNFDQVVHEFTRRDWSEYNMEIVLLIKCDNLYVSRIRGIPLIVREREDGTSMILSWEKSSVRFLSVEYCHPLMWAPISLEIDKGYYLEGNHLLSAAFVRRCLEYQNDPKDYYFDMDYTLTIMDNEINMIELTSKNYIILNKDGYTYATK